MSRMRVVGAAVAGAAMTVLGALDARAQAAAEAFYKGRDIHLLIGSNVGGTYGLYAQLAARHLRKHIPGQPNVIMQNMPGAGGLIGLNYSYGVAPKDGSLIHLVHAEVVYETLLTPGVKFNASHYRFIGRITDADSVALSSKASAIRTLEDARRREVTMGSTGFSNVYALAPTMLNRVAGTKFRVVAGYKGSSDIMLAIQRGELDGAGVTLANALTIHGEKLRSGELVPFLAIAGKRLVQYPDVPAMTEFGSDVDKALMEIYASLGTVGRALAVPPGVPDDRVQALRGAFARMLEDADFKAEVQRSDIPLAPMKGEDLEAYIAGVMRIPADRVEAVRKLHVELLGPAKGKR